MTELASLPAVMMLWALIPLIIGRSLQYSLSWGCSDQLIFSLANFYAPR